MEDVCYNTSINQVTLCCFYESMNYHDVSTFHFISKAQRIIKGLHFFMQNLLKILITMFLSKMAITDGKMQKLYNKDLIRLLILTIADLSMDRNPQMSDTIIGILIVSMPMLVITLFWPGSFGGGDIKIMAICGLLLGREGILHAAWIALLTASAYAIGILVLRKSRKAEFALGPFICVGVLCVYLNIL